MFSSSYLVWTSEQPRGDFFGRRTTDKEWWGAGIRRGGLRPAATCEEAHEAGGWRGRLSWEAHVAGGRQRPVGRRTVGREGRGAGVQAKVREAGGGAAARRRRDGVVARAETCGWARWRECIFTQFANMVVFLGLDWKKSTPPNRGRWSFFFGNHQ